VEAEALGLALDGVWGLLVGETPESSDAPQAERSSATLNMRVGKARPAPRLRLLPI
jgi:hypothetical protein